MRKKIKESADQLDKRKKTQDLQIKLQSFVNDKNVCTMQEFRDSWNKKNQEKIQELVKIQDRMICRFNNCSITINIGTMTI